MAGALTMVETQTQTQIETSKSKMAVTREQWQWQVKYSRCFTYPSFYLSNISAPPIPLSTMKQNLFKPVWISTSGSAIVSLHHSVDASSSNSDSIITVSLQGEIIEEHFISKLHFTWPQVSCLSGFPARGSLVVFASYTDSADEKQKFALRFSTISETEDFITSLEDILSNKLPHDSHELPAVDVISAISSQSDFIPPYRPDISSMTPTCASPLPTNLQTQDLQESQAPPEVTGSESNLVAFPPRFTSLVSTCSAEIEKGNLALALPNEPQGFNLKAQIAKYMQDASFLDIVSKVNDVISELGDGFVL